MFVFSGTILIYREKERKYSKITYCWIIRIRKGLIFVEFVGTRHPRIFNEVIYKILIEQFNEKKKLYITLRYGINKQASVCRVNNDNNQIIAPLF